MLFNSLPFLVFLLLFYPVWLLLPRKARNAWMLAGSYFFYGWWDWRFLGLLAVSTLVDFSVGRALARCTRPGRRRTLLLASVATNLGILGLFKYFDFFLAQAAELLAAIGLPSSVPVLRVILPVGISFYTFQTLSYTIDIYRGRLAPERNLIDFALFVAFFPQLVAGPIERASRLLPQLRGGPWPRPGDLAQGLRLMTMGMVLKVLIGDRLAPIVDETFVAPEEHGSLFLLRGLIFFALQIYCDFSGYSLIARGTARLFGVDVMVNFRQPYLAANITEFWRRWHISLSSWLKDYLYIPLGGNRKGRARTYANLLLTMLLGGLWHGASWTFVVWGGLHGLYLACHKAFFGPQGTPLPHSIPFVRIMGALLSIGATFALVLFAWLFFRAESFAAAFCMLEGILALRGPAPAGMLAHTLALLALVFAIDLLLAKLGREELIGVLPRGLRPGIVAGIWVLLVIHFCLGSDAPFIYFQF